MINQKGTVVLSTDRLILRPFVKKDLPEIFLNCWSIYDVWKWTNYPLMDSMEDVIQKGDMFTEGWLAAYERLDRYSWAIVERKSGMVIGRLFACHPDLTVSQIELTYELGKKWWNLGLMSEAVRRVIAYLIDEVGFNRVYAYHAGPNLASGRVMEKCGMAKEGVLRDGCTSNCGVYDKVIYAILRTDYLREQRKTES
jgi:[ribosomal protein S5]-alanine N-acetyltransferase